MSQMNMNSKKLKAFCKIRIRFFQGSDPDTNPVNRNLDPKRTVFDATGDPDGGGGGRGRGRRGMPGSIELGKPEMWTSSWFSTLSGLPIDPEYFLYLYSARTPLHRRGRIGGFGSRIRDFRGNKSNQNFWPPPPGHKKTPKIWKISLNLPILPYFYPFLLFLP
mgnify:CR=1 FL=1